MNARTQWYVVQIAGDAYGIFRDYTPEGNTTYIECFRLRGKPARFDSPAYAMRAAAHLNTM